MTKPMKGRKTRDVNFNMGPKFKIQKKMTNQTPFPYSVNNNEVVLISRITKIELHD